MDPDLQAEIDLLTDWEIDEWTRVFIKIDRSARLSYTFSLTEATEKKFSSTCGSIAKSYLKSGVPETPKSAKLKKSKGLSSDSSKKTRTSTSASSDYGTDTDETTYYQLRLENAKKSQVAVVRSKDQMSLKKIQNQIKDALQQLENLGLPLTIEPHDASHSSLLSTEAEGNEVSLRGLVNLLVLLLCTYHLRAIAGSLHEDGFVLVDSISNFAVSGVHTDLKNYSTFFATVALLLFPVIGFILEKMACAGVPDLIIVPIVFIYTSLQLVYPVVMIQWLESSSLPATYFMVFSVGQYLKLVSFHHVMHDNHYLAKRLSEAKSEEEKTAAYYNISEEQFEVAKQYPANLRIGHYIRFLMSPTCCYQHYYPTTPSISIVYLMKRFFEFAIGNLIVVYLVMQHILPVAQEALEPIRAGDKFGILMSTLKMAVPSAYVWLIEFYCFFHSYLNFWAELCQFADRRFYSDWWNANNLGEYWRKWNHPIHNFLIRHVYYPLRRKNVNGAACMLATFTVSAIFHEYVVVGIFSVVNFIAFILMMVNVPCMIFQRQFKNQVSGNTNNFLFWLFYIILGQPFGIIFSYYQINDKNQQVSLQVDVPPQLAQIGNNFHSQLQAQLDFIK